MRMGWRSAVLGVMLGACAAAGAQRGLTAGSPCATGPHRDHPVAYLTNGQVDLVVYLPDAERGYYRSSRFDWAGIVACASYRGHTYFGEWFSRYDPMTNDAVTGPVEEFRAPDGRELGYAEAAVGGEFVKPGVGVLRKIDDGPYQFGKVYPIVDHGRWKVKVSGREAVFTQRLRSKSGYAYEYTKTVELDAQAPVFTLRHSLKNVGTQAIETAVYDHDFYMLDNRRTGVGDVVTFGFAPVAVQPLGDAAEIRGDAIVFTHAVDKEHAAQGYLRGFTGKPGEYSVHLTDAETHTGVLQTSESPVARAYFWSTERTICPELYIPIDVQPGAEQRWAIRYELEAEK